MSQREWFPPSLERAFSNRSLRLDRLSYVVVDELESGHGGLSVYQWPHVDDFGRVRFDLDEEAHVAGVSAEGLQRFISRHRLPRKGARRRLRIGDVFAVETGELPTGFLEEPSSWLRPPVYDITVDARDAAKAAFFAAVAPTLDAERDRETVALAQSRTPLESSPPLES